MVKEKKIDRFKRHINKHKTVYISAGVGALSAGFTYLIMRNHAGIRGVPASGIQRVPGGAEAKATVIPFMFFCKDNNILTSVHRNSAGPPSYMVECLEDNLTWLSQKAAAAAKGIHPSVLSGHLNGKFSDIDGEHFRRIGVAVA